MLKMWQRVLIFCAYGFIITLLVVFAARRVRAKVSKRVQYALLFLIGFLEGFALIIGAWYATPVSRPFWKEWKVFIVPLILAIAFALPPSSQWRKQIRRKALQ